MSADHCSDLAASSPAPHSGRGMRGQTLTGVATGQGAGMGGRGSGRSMGGRDIVKYQSTGIVKQFRDVNAELLETGTYM